ncbi:MAG: DUF1501 domain-containing protein, partial [Planctomycetes bacterium]|nr:DUF1501 domain-containing protein [Planctomycetota bacterium]
MLSDTIDTLGRSILGLAIGCARCHLGSPASVELQALELEMLGAFNRKHLQKRETDSGNLAARIKSFETAFGMQIAAPEVFDLSLETDATLRLYGLERGST